MICCLLYYGFLAGVIAVLIRFVLELIPIGGLEDKTVVITGTDTGFGHMLTLKLLQNGATVFAGCLTEKGKEELEKKGKSLPGTLYTMTMDVTNQASMDKCVELVKARLQGKGLWGLVNNAGIVGLTGMDDFCNVDDYKGVLEVNTLGVIRSTHCFKQLIKRRKGRIVTVASVLGRGAVNGAGPYTVSKYACEGYCDTLRIEMEPFGVKCCTLEPGFFQTNITDPKITQMNFERIWKRAGAETRQEYGEAFFSGSVRAIDQQLTQFASTRTDYVVDAYYHALTSRFPRSRYHVGWDSILFFVPLSMTPTWFGDWVMRKWGELLGLPKPASTLAD